MAAVDNSAAIVGTSFTALAVSVADDLPQQVLTHLYAFDRRQERDRSLQAFGLRTQGEGEHFRYC